MNPTSVRSWLDWAKLVRASLIHLSKVGLAAIMAPFASFIRQLSYHRRSGAPARAGLGHKNSPAKTLQRGYQSPGCGGRCRDLVNVLLPHEFHKTSAKGWVRQSFYHPES